jgi:hypothetical protein
LAAAPLTGSTGLTVIAAQPHRRFPSGTADGRALTQPAGPSPKVRRGMNIRRVLLDVDKAIQRPEIIDIAKAIDAAPGVAGLNITVTEIDVQTVGMDITVEGDNIDVGALFRAIESTGAVVHSIDELAAGERLVERIARRR